jgi:hypothetical protein
MIETVTHKDQQIVNIVRCRQQGFQISLRTCNHVFSSLLTLEFAFIR